MPPGEDAGATEKKTFVPQLFRIISGKNPFQAWLMVFLFVVSFPILFNAPAPNSVQTVVPHWVILIWAFMMCCACIVNLLGIYWRRRLDTSIRLELYSCIVLAIANLMYPASLITFSLDSGISNIWYAATLLFGLSICAMGRFYQLLGDRKEVNAVKKLIKAAGVLK